MDKIFIEFCEKIKTKSRSLPQFLAPFIGILVNLYRAIPNLSKIQEMKSIVAIKLSAEQTQLSSNFDNLASLFNKMDSFDPTLFTKCYELVFKELPPKNEFEAEFFKSYQRML